jgi:excisionase family DNA binding protein
MQPDQITPRLISKREVAAYLGYSEKSLEKLVAAGVIPGPIAGTHRFDRRAIDAALDRASGIESGA